MRLLVGGLCLNAISCMACVCGLVCTQESNTHPSSKQQAAGSLWLMPVVYPFAGIP